MKPLTLKTLALALLVMAPTDAGAQDIETILKQVRVGAPREDLVKTLGPPSDTMESNLAGIRLTTLRWLTAGGRSISADLVFGTVYRIQICSAGVTAKC